MLTFIALGDMPGDPEILRERLAQSRFKNSRALRFHYLRSMRDT